MLRLLAGLIGAVVCVIVGTVATFFVAIIWMDGDGGFGFLLGIVVLPWAIGVSAILGVVAGLLVLRYRRSDKWSDGPPRRKVFMKMALALGPIALVAAMIWGILQMSNPPSDNALLRQFQRHRATLDRIVQMAQADKWLGRVGPNWIEQDGPQHTAISPARLREYRRLLDSADVRNGFQICDRATEINFYCWSEGAEFGTDTDKGFAYLAKPPAHTLSSLDGYDPGGESVVVAYRHITGHWYLYYDYLPG